MGLLIDMKHHALAVPKTHLEVSGINFNDTLRITNSTKHMVPTDLISPYLMPLN